MSSIHGYLTASPLSQIPGPDVGEAFDHALRATALFELARVVRSGDKGAWADVSEQGGGTEEDGTLAREVEKLRREGVRLGIEVMGELEWESGNHTRRLRLRVDQWETRAKEGTISWKPGRTMGSEN